jgi:capsular polysaccharide transport system permease protein
MTAVLETKPSEEPTPSPAHHAVEETTASGGTEPLPAASEVTTPPPEQPAQTAPAKLVDAEEEVESDSKFVLIRIVTMPFAFLRKKKNDEDARSLAVRETAVSPHVTHLELQERGASSGAPPRRQIPWSFLLIVVLPTLLAFLYYGFLASDQYESTSDYVIKTQGGGDSAPGLAGILGAVGMGGHSDGLASSDSAMVESYVSSDQILRDLSSEIDLRAIYATSEVDWISRLKSTPDFFSWISGRKTRRTTTRTISDEDLLSYWKGKVDVSPGKAPGTSTLKVRAFTPEDAKAIADRVVTLGERLVNHVSERAMKDAVVFAQKEVDSAHDRAMSAYDELQQFQAKVKQVDPEGYAKARSEIQGRLEGQLSTTQAQMEALRQKLPDEAPGIQQLRTQVSALQEQLLVEKNRSTTGDAGKSAAEVITEFGKRQLDTEFASKDYLSALSALESARINANRQNRYLEPFNLPNLPDKPALPRRAYSIVTVLAVCLLLWGGWTLFIAGVKEHQY